MAIFYKGAGVGTYWHTKDASSAGFLPANALAPSLDRVIDHIAMAGTWNSPFVSLTRSYGIARDYAVFFGRTVASAASPGFVYEIEIDENNVPRGLVLIDPLRELILNSSSPFNCLYSHYGDMSFVLSIANPSIVPYLSQIFWRPGRRKAPGPPPVSPELRTLAFALRDAEVLAAGVIPKNYVLQRHAEW